MSTQQNVVKNESSQTNKATAKQNSETNSAILPRVDVFEDATGITLIADLPGVPKDKLSLNVEGETLQIEGEITSEMPEDIKAIYAEVQTPRYRRLFTLSRELDTEKIDASFKNGVLNLRIPKLEHAQPRKIEVRVS
jgi:HSP20 family protein